MNPDPTRGTSHVDRLRAHLDQAGPPPRVVIENQFGVDVLRLIRFQRLCLPSTTRLLGVRGQAPRKPLAENHFTCYRVKGSPIARQVVLTDQFDVERVRTVRPFLLCAPARKRSEPVPHPLRHLTCYQTAPLGKTPFTPRKVVVRNQFGARILTVRGARDALRAVAQVPLRRRPSAPAADTQEAAGPCPGTAVGVDEHGWELVPAHMEWAPPR